jgi:hypothetical protein
MLTTTPKRNPASSEGHGQARREYSNVILRLVETEGACPP